METIAAMNAVCAVVSAKWALELGFGQFRQILYLIAGCILGPLGLLILYVHLILKAKKAGEKGANWF